LHEESPVVSLCATELPWNGGNRLVNLLIMQLLLAKQFAEIKDLISARIYLKAERHESDILPPSTIASIMKDAGTLESAFESLGLKLSHAATWRFLQLSQPTKTDVNKFVDDVESRFYDELGAISFIHLTPDRAQYYQNQKPFGDLVFNRFPAAEYDIEESSKYFAFERHTATVMHSMRVLEVGLTVLAKSLKVKRRIKGWGNDLSKFEKQWQSIIASNPKRLGWKRSFIPQLFLHFHYFADAWRNRAFHNPRARYGDCEARQVFEHVRDFMQLLATRLSEKKS
jgi:hypothetical protein